MLNKMKLFIFIAFNACMATSAAVTDKTLEPKFIGHDVVEAVIKKITESNIFADEKGFLKRIAYVESRFGTDKKTFREGYYGGIWQIDAGETGAFTRIMDSIKFNTALNRKIKDKFGIDWSKVKYEDLLKPLYSGLAARIWLYMQTGLIPEYYDINGQALYWKNYYHSEDGKVSTNDFITRVKEMDTKYNCRGRMDLNIVLDGSGSIDEKDFKVAKEFVADLIGTFSTDHVNLAVIVYSDYPTVLFDFDTHLTQSQMRERVMNAIHPRRATHTSEAILKGIELLKKLDQRNGRPRIMAIFTDGNPTNPVDRAVASAQLNSVTIFAVGIGAGIDHNELLKMTGDVGARVFSMVSYEALSHSFHLMNSETCKVPQRPPLGQSVEDVLGEFEKRYYDFPVPAKGITVSIEQISGQIKGYYSYTDANPNAAMHQGAFEEQVFIPAPSSQRRKRDIKDNKVFVTVEGNEGNNTYKIASEQGNHVSASRSLQLHSICQLIVILIAFFKFL